MPIYQYHCTSCGNDLEIFQHMTDSPLKVCPQCQGKLRKVFSPVGIVFKGSGFYATDSKKGSSATSPATTTPATTTTDAAKPEASGSSESAAAPTPSTAPAPASPATGSSASTATPSGTSSA